MTKLQDGIGVLILAAGNSTRMGCPKFLLKYNDESCFLQKIIENYTSFGCSEIKVVLNKTGTELLEKNHLQVIDKKDIIINSRRSSERFYSVKLGLSSFKSSSWIFIHHVDNPFVEIDVLNSLIKHKLEAEYIVPSYQGKGGHPVLIGKKIIKAITETKQNDQHFKEFLAKYSGEKVSVNSTSIFTNINTRDEYHQFFGKK